MGFYENNAFGERRSGKYRGLISVTNELLAQGMFGLPEEVSIIDVISDEREVTHLRIRSEQEVVGLTTATGQGQEPEITGDTVMLMAKAAIKRVCEMENAEKDSYMRAIYEQALAELTLEGYFNEN